MASTSIRPTKKQKELLEFISEFIAQHGYSPSYREIMSGKGYTSVATVALHVNSLIKRGHLQKRDRSARSLEVVAAGTTSGKAAKPVSESEAKWLISHIESLFIMIESNPAPTKQELDNVYVLVGALKVLGLEDAARSFIPRLSALKNNNEA